MLECPRIDDLGSKRGLGNPKKAPPQGVKERQGAVEQVGVMTVPAQQLLLTAGTAGPEFTGLLVGLFTAISGTPTPTTVLTDLTEPTYTGYARSSAVVWGAAGYDPVEGDSYVVSTSTKQFVGPADASGQSVLGWFLVLVGAHPPADSLIACGLFSTPVSMRTATDQINLTPSVGAIGNAEASLTI